MYTLRGTNGLNMCDLLQTIIMTYSIQL